MWGAPNRSTRTDDGREWHTWVNYAPVAAAGSSVGFGMGSGIGRHSGVGVGFGMPIGAPPPPPQCERTFVVSGGHVAEQHWNGPADFCAGFIRPAPR